MKCFTVFVTFTMRFFRFLIFWILYQWWVIWNDLGKSKKNSFILNINAAFDLGFRIVLKMFTISLINFFLTSFWVKLYCNFKFCTVSLYFLKILHQGSSYLNNLCVNQSIKSFTYLKINHSPINIIPKWSNHSIHQSIN